MGISDKAWNQRILCSDGNCIGIIGSDGRCKECGRAYEGELPASEEEDLVAESDGDAAAAESEGAHEGQEVADLSTDSDASGDEWKDRTLCIDGNCIGVVGPDGRCKVCGKAHPGKQS